MSEKRKHPRRTIQAEVTFQAGDGGRIEACCRDLSLGGMFIETPTSLRYGDALRVFIRLPGIKDEVGIDAIVRWTTPVGMGVQFQRMGARETHGLTQLLATE